MEIEVIEWVDSSAMGYWHNKDTHLDAAKDLMNCRTVGFVFFEDDARVALAQSVTGRANNKDDQFSHSITIPKVSIISRAVLPLP